MNIFRRDRRTQFGSKMFERLLEGKYPTGLYVILYESNDPVIVEVDGHTTTQIVNTFLSYFEDVVLDNPHAKTLAFERGLKANIFNTILCKVTALPYIVYFINEQDMEPTSYFFTAEADDKLRFAKDWSKYVKS